LAIFCRFCAATALSTRTAIPSGGKAASAFFASITGIGQGFPRMSLTLFEDKPTVTASAIGLLEGSEIQPLAVARYDTPVTQSIRGRDITYDLVYIQFVDSENNLQKFNVWLVNSEEMNSPDPLKKEEYRAYHLSCIGNTSGMWSAYQKLIEKK
jgi:hypothetical protein